jgi:hypothetical protein
MPKRQYSDLLKLIKSEKCMFFKKVGDIESKELKIREGENTKKHYDARENEFLR